MESEVALSVVMPACDAAATIEQQLAALADQAPSQPWDLVVVIDPRTTDATAEVVARWTDRVRTLSVVRASSGGASASRNTGVARSRGHALAFCDADDVVGQTWVAGLMEALEDADLASGPIELARLNAEELYSWRRSPGWPGPLPPWLGFLHPMMGCNMAVRRATFDRLGGFDESLTHGEDFDFAWRAQLAGATVGFSPEATVHRRLRRGWPAFRSSVMYGSADVTLFRRFAGSGLPPRRLRGLARVVAAVVATPLLFVRRYRYGWVHLAGVEVGRIAGSVHERVLFL